MVDNVIYEAGGPPGWSIEIGDDIGLWLGHAFHDDPVAYTIRLFPRTHAREWDGIRRWRSTSGDRVIMIEARPGPCTSPGGAVYADHVRMRRNWDPAEYRDLTGCGGRLISEPARN